MSRDPRHIRAGTGCAECGCVVENGVPIYRCDNDRCCCADLVSAAIAREATQR